MLADKLVARPSLHLQGRSSEGPFSRGQRDCAEVQDKRQVHTLSRFGCTVINWVMLLFLSKCSACVVKVSLGPFLIQFILSLYDTLYAWWLYKTRHKNIWMFSSNLYSLTWMFCYMDLGFGPPWSIRNIMLWQLAGDISWQQKQSPRSQGQGISMSSIWSHFIFPLHEGYTWCVLFPLSV